MAPLDPSGYSKCCAAFKAVQETACLPAVYHKGGYLLEANLISSPPQCGRVMLHP